MATEMLQYLDPDGLNETVLNIGQIKTSLEEAMQDLPYARPDGLYPDMTVGAVIGADETSQWAERESAASGTVRVESVQGAAVVWNQLAPAMDSSTWSATQSINVTVDSVHNSVNMVSVTDTSTSKQRIRSDSSLPSEHVWYIACTVDTTNSASSATFGLYKQDGTNSLRLSVEAGQAAARYSTLGAATNPVIYGIKLANATVQGDGAIFSNLIIIDLTATFGSGNEPQTVAEFERMYPESYYPYSAPTLKPVRIAGIESTDANGDALDSVEWGTQTLRAVGSVADVLYSDHVDVKVGVVDLGTLNWTYRAANAVFYANAGDSMWPFDNSANATSIVCARYEITTPTGITTTSMPDKSIARRSSANSTEIIVSDSSYTTVADFTSAVSGAYLFFVLATPTTTPISPALPMTYRVEQGGAESIIVPEGEISAAPILTIADPVNMGSELARIWAAIEALQSRSSLQLSRPVTQTDVAIIDDVQKDTAEIAEIDEIKEVQE